MILSRQEILEISLQQKKGLQPFQLKTIPKNVVAGQRHPKLYPNKK